MSPQDNRHKALSGFLLRQYSHAFLRSGIRDSAPDNLLNWIQLSRINRDLLALMIQARADQKPHSYSDLQELANISRNTVKNAVRLAVEWGIAEVTYNNTKAQIMVTESAMTQYFEWLENVVDAMDENEKKSLSNLLDA